MRITGIYLQEFRNFACLRAKFSACSQFIVGANGQGKTNLLEAISLISHLRSFRTTDLRAVFRAGAVRMPARLLFEIEHDRMGPTVLEMTLERGAKRLLLDGQPLRRLTEMVGLFPTVVLCSQDLQLIRGGPQLRRRLLDMMFVDMDPAYFNSLLRYHHALKSRNALLKQRGPAASMRVFEELLIEEGWALVDSRRRLLSAFEPHFRAAYAELTPVDEQPRLSYEPSLDADNAVGFADQFREQQRRDLEQGTTGKGPHRDDLGIFILNQPCKEFASEGQQRALALALRLGLVRWYRDLAGTVPVILADDVIGELDGDRRSGFWRSVNASNQVFATGTQLPDAVHGIEWQYWRMSAAELQGLERSSASGC